MKKNYVSLVALSSAVAIVVGACSNVASYEVQLPDTIALSELDVYTEANPIEIDFWTGFGGGVTPHIEAGITQFQSLYPNIKVTHSSKGGYDNLLKAVNLSITSRSYPQIAVGYPDHFASYIRSSIQYALDPFIESDEYGLDISDIVADYMPENKSYLFDEDGNPYTLGLPFNKSTEVMVVNQSFFDFIATIDPTIVVPQTWAEVRTTGLKILDRMKNTQDIDGDAGIFGKRVIFNASTSQYRIVKPTGTLPTGFALRLDFTNVIEADFRPFSYDSMANFFITAIRQWGSTYTQMGDDITKGFIRFNNPTVASMLNYFKGLHDENVLAIPITFGETSYNSAPFRGNKSVMSVSSSAGVFNNVPSAGAFNVSIHPIPYQDANRKFVISQGTNMALFTNRNSHKVLAAWLFMRYMTTSPGNTQFSVGAGYYPSTESGLNSSFYQGYLNSTNVNASDKSKIDSAIVNASYYGNPEEKWIKFVDPGFVGSSDIREQVDTVFPIVFYGKDGEQLTAQEVLDFIQQNLSRYVEES